MSVAGGLPRAIERAVLHRCEALQIFTKNASQWRGRDVPLDEIHEFRAQAQTAGISPIVSHASYLINLASTNATLRAQSMIAMGDELDRAEALALMGVVLHPGCYTLGSEAQGLALIGDGLLELLDERPGAKTMVLLEHTAGQGTSLGSTFEQLAAILDRTHGHTRIGVCLDTCHLLASGYDIVTESGYRETFEAFDRLVGLGRLKAFHANDSKKPCASRVDRHEHIGRGCLGEAPFRRLLHDPRFSGLPLLIETEKSPAPSRAGAIILDPLDVQNLDTLRRLRAGA